VARKEEAPGPLFSLDRRRGHSQPASASLLVALLGTSCNRSGCSSEFFQAR